MRGKLYGIGVGPGDPELITLKGLKALRSADVIAFHLASGKTSNALAIAGCWLGKNQKKLPLIYPVTTEILSQGQEYQSVLAAFYRETEQTLRRYLDDGQNVAVLAEGDPLFYSSFMYIYDRLGNEYETTVIPGVTSVSAAAAALGAPLCYRNQIFTVLPGVLDQETLEKQMSMSQAFAIMKVGRNLDRIRAALGNTGLLERALYIERATMAGETVIPLSEVTAATSPYFSIILVPGKPWNR